TVHCSESQWDMLSLADKLRLDQSIGVVTFSTRGAGNAKLLSCIPKDAGAVFLWPQNDEAGRRWLQRAIEVLADRHPRTVRIPDGVKDLNDWVKAGATGQDIQSAIDSARIAEPADAIDPGTDSNTTDAQDQSRKQRPNKEESDEHATEHQLVERLKQQLPPLRCVASAWYTYENGAWRRGTIDIYRPQALAIQNARNRSQHRATSVLNHLESTAQVNEEEFSSFYKFDGEAILINCANGVLRVTAGTEKLLPHSPGYLFTGQVAANFDRDAIAPIFEKILQEALPDPEDLTLFKLFAGYILYPACSFEAALVCYGDGGTGKSTIAGGIRAALGADLVKSLTLLQICDPKSFHLVNLRNAAVNLSAELDALPVKGAENFKLLVSGEQVSADRKYHDLVSLNTECKFLFLTNYLPRFQHGTDAELRRLRFLRFERKPAKPDPRLKQQVALEADGIFRLMVDGLRTLLVQQEIPQGGKQSSGTRERFKIQNDPVSAFVNSCCRINPKAEELKSVLYDEYKEFLEANGIPAPQESSTFFRALYNRFQIKDIKRRDAGKLIPKIAGIELLPDE
ncbi:MAG: phage/plasmid primase, P4 family, partial [Chthoniobacterales bacterium]